MFGRLQDARSALVILGLLGSSPVSAEAAGRWIDPPSDRELLQMPASIPLPPDEALVSTSVSATLDADIGETGPTALGSQVDSGAALGPPDVAISSLGTDEIDDADKPGGPAPASAEVRKNPKPSKAAARGRARKAASGEDPIARLFGPPRRDSHVITTTHTR
jgi:hypothetical protein